MVIRQTLKRNKQPGGILREDDILLTLNGRIFTRISKLDVMYDNEFIDAVIVRGPKEVHLKLLTVAADHVETDYAISFCGAILHRPHHAVCQQISELFSNVYVSAVTEGSPASQYGLEPAAFITGVTGKRTTDLESFIAAVRRIPDNEYFRLKAVTFRGLRCVITMKKNEHYFPTTEWIKDSSEECGWRHMTRRAVDLMNMLEQWKQFHDNACTVLPTGRPIDGWTPTSVDPPEFGLALQVYSFAKILICMHCPDKFNDDSTLSLIAEAVGTICGIAMELTELRCQVVSSQCLFAAGLCVQDPRQQQTIISLYSCDLNSRKRRRLF